jgi:hypothetical protein
VGVTLIGWFWPKHHQDAVDARPAEARGHELSPEAP